MGKPRIGQRRQLGRFDDTGVARRKRRGQRPGCHLKRVIPRDDLRRYAERFVGREIEIGLAQRNGAAFDGFGLIAVVFKVTRSAQNLGAGFPKRLALFEGQHRRDIVNMVGDVPAHGLHQTAPLDRAHIRQNTGQMYAARGGDSAVHIRSISQGMFGEAFAIAGVEHVNAPSAPIDPCPVDVILPVWFYVSHLFARSRLNVCVREPGERVCHGNCKSRKVSEAQSSHVSFGLFASKSAAIPVIRNKLDVICKRRSNIGPLQVVQARKETTDDFAENNACNGDNGPWRF